MGGHLGPPHVSDREAPCFQGHDGGYFLHCDRGRKRHGTPDDQRQNQGGGFGRRGAFHDYVTQAVLIAKQMPGTSVKLLWSSEEDMTHGRYHPVMQAKLTGALDASGNLTGLHCRLSGLSIITSVFPQLLQDGRDNLTFKGPLKNHGVTLV